MRFTSPSRRALGLVAAGTIGMSTAVLGVAGVASAEPVVQAEDGDLLAATTAAAQTVGFTVPEGTCAVRFGVAGGAGDAAGFEGGAAGLVGTTTLVTAGQEYTLVGGDAYTTPGGNGEASSVSGPGGFSVVTPGGSGTNTPRGDNTVSSAAVSIEADNDVNGTTADTEFDGGPGFALAVGVACPEAPTAAYAQGATGAVELRFSEPIDDVEEPLDDDLTYEFSVNGGAWTILPVTSTDPTTRQVAGTVTGLTDGTSYSFAVRTVSDIGTSASTATFTGTPYTPIGAPQGVVVTRSTSAVTVTWSAPVTPGTYALTGYTVGYSGGNSGDEACRLPAGTTTCTFALPAGADYLISVLALDAGEHTGDAARVQSGVIPSPAVPASVPTRDDGDIVGPAGPISSVTAGQKLTLVGTGFAPNSTVQVTVFSSPVSLGTVVTDATGSFSVEVTVPADLANGTHTLVATGIAPDGSTRNLVITVTVSGGVATLANTGFDVAVPLTGGALALLAGAGLLVGARRRSS